MPNNAKTARGGQVVIFINSTWMLIPGVDGVQPFGSKKSFIETTPLDETTGRTYVDDLPDPGLLKFTVFHDMDNAIHDYMASAAQTLGQADLIRYQPFGRAKFYQMNTLIGTFQPSGQQGKAQMSDFEAKITGAISRTSGNVFA